MSEGSKRHSAATAAADKVRAIVEAAEHSAAELRAEAAEEIEAQLELAQAVGERLSRRADQIERSLQGLADSVRDELSALKADLEELRAVGEGVREPREPGSAAAEPEPAPAVETEPQPAPSVETKPEPEPEEPDREQPEALEPEEPQAPEPEPEAAAPGDTASGLAAERPAGDGHEGARVIALNMALNGSPREETARYLAENFEIADPEALLDEVYARVSS
jgi:outer membrane biosynthesis protein TonB